MDLFTLLLVGVVAFYVAMMCITTAKPIIRYEKAKDRVRNVEAIFDSAYGDEKTKIKGKLVRIYYPIYKASVNGNQYTLKSLVREVGDFENRIGEKITLLFDDETGELWCEKDIPLMMKQIKTRLLMMAILVALVIVTGVAL